MAVLLLASFAAAGYRLYRIVANLVAVSRGNQLPDTDVIESDDCIH